MILVRSHTVSLHLLILQLVLTSLCRLHTHIPYLRFLSLLYSLLSMPPSFPLCPHLFLLEAGSHSVAQAGSQTCHHAPLPSWMVSSWVGLVNWEAESALSELLIHAILSLLDKQLGVIKLKCYLLQMRKYLLHRQNTYKGNQNDAHG